MIQKELKIINRLGLHARPAAQIAQTAGNFACKLTLCKDHVSVNAKSIMGVMMLAAECGATLQLTADGSDEVQAVAAIEKLVADKFNEEF